ncbi:MAG: diaminopimelate epimerase [Armatimonadetes bacterium]|nr:diaminopimelate epimerase [Armatimonadota bacterium]
MRFWKVQAAGNDFILFDRRCEPEEDWAALAPRLCNRHTGVGSDGLLILLPSARADYRVRMFNPDGSEDFCGNGLRGVGRYLHAAGIFAGDTLSLETFSGERRLRYLPRPGGAPEITVNMGAPVWNAAAIPARAPADPVIGVPLQVAGVELTVTSLSTGTAHTVIFTEELPEDALFFAASPAIEHHPWFPERTSVLWCRVEAPDRLRLRIWERGVGETLACGTGVCAAAAAARHHGLAGDSVRVFCPGGEFEVTREGEALWLRGPAEIVFSGTLAPALLRGELAG